MKALISALPGLALTAPAAAAASVIAGKGNIIVIDLAGKAAGAFGEEPLSVAAFCGA